MRALAFLDGLLLAAVGPILVGAELQLAPATPAAATPTVIDRGDCFRPRSSHSVPPKHQTPSCSCATATATTTTTTTTTTTASRRADCFRPRSKRSAGPEQPTPSSNPSSSSSFTFDAAYALPPGRWVENGETDYRGIPVICRPDGHCALKCYIKAGEAGWCGDRWIPARMPPESTPEQPRSIHRDWADSGVTDSRGIPIVCHNGNCGPRCLIKYNQSGWCGREWISPGGRKVPTPSIRITLPTNGPEDDFAFALHSHAAVTPTPAAAAAAATAAPEFTPAYIIDAQLVSAALRDGRNPMVATRLVKMIRDANSNSKWEDAEGAAQPTPTM